MSMHEMPLTELDRSGLYVHGLEIGKPSQLSDAFRLGVAWALLTDQERKVVEQRRKKDKSK